MAKQALAKSSVPDGFEFSCLIVAGDQFELQQAQILQSEWAKIGVKLNVDAVDMGTIWTRWGSGDESCFTFTGAGLSSDALSDDNLAVVFFNFNGGIESVVDRDIFRV